MTGCTIRGPEGIIVVEDAIIKPCPNCGCDAVVDMYYEDKTMTIRCPGGCTIMGRMDAVQAVTIWNTWADKLKEESDGQ